MQPRRFGIAAFILALTTPAAGGAGQAFAATPPKFDDGSSQTETIDQIRLSPFRFERMTLPVSIDSGPPLSFLIDTGAEISGVTPEVARTYGFAQTGSRTVIGIAGRQEVATVRVSGLRFAHSDSADMEALLFSRQAMGADGYLGIDSLADQRIEFDFVNNRMQLRRSSRMPMRLSERSVVVRTREENGRLIFSTARVNRTDAIVILDTGSTVTVGNAELMRQLAAKGRLGHTVRIEILSVTGKMVSADYAILREVMIGDVLIRRLPVAFATVEPFRHLGWEDRPALLLGMDALRAFAKVTVDFRNRAVKFVARNYDNEATIRIGAGW